MTPFAVRGVERRRDLRADVHRAHDVDRGLARQHRRERQPLEVLHDVVVIAVGRHAEIVDLDDVLVADLVDGLRLLEEARHDIAVRREVLMDDLERDLLADRRVLGEVDRAHAARPDLGQDAVVPDGLARGDHSDR